MGPSIWGSEREREEANMVSREKPSGTGSVGLIVSGPNLLGSPVLGGVCFLGPHIPASSALELFWVSLVGFG